MDEESAVAIYGTYGRDMLKLIDFPVLYLRMCFDTTL